MDRESVERLRFDRRLQRRRDWIGTGEFESHLEGLPDVASKMTTAAELEAEEAAAAEAGGGGPSEPAASDPLASQGLGTQQASSVAGGFSPAGSSSESERVSGDAPRNESGEPSRWNDPSGSPSS